MTTKRKLFKPSYAGTRPHVKEVVRKTMPKAWWRLRQKFLKANPWCAHCAANGKKTKGDQVDHVVPRTVAPERTLDWYNLQTLCWPCHKLKTKADMQYGKRPSHLKEF